MSNFFSLSEARWQVKTLGREKLTRKQRQTQILRLLLSLSHSCFLNVGRGFMERSVFRELYQTRHHWTGKCDRIGEYVELDKCG